MIGVVGGQHDLAGIDGILLVAPEGPMRHAEVHLREERLAGLALRPIGAVERYDRRREVPVGLARPLIAEPRTVAGVIARPPEVLRNHPRRVGKPVSVIAMAAMIVRPDAGLVHPRHKGRAGGRAHRAGHEGIREPGPVTGQLVQVRRPDQRVAVAAHVRGGVLGDQPENVRPVLGG